MNWWPETSCALAVCHAAVLVISCCVQPLYGEAPAGEERDWAAAETLWNEEDPSASPIDNLALPLEHHENGAVRTLLRADHALVPPRGLIRATRVTTEWFDQDRRPMGVIKADRCLYDRQQQRGVCLGSVQLERQGLSMQGSNVLWISSEQLVKVFSDAQVRFNRKRIDAEGPNKP
ncbi:MAG: hypothetical protein JXB13_05895 [Phycisphaerae bacterium]|nr:hypothetical protein [Phycisphaerae bacterium]